MFLAPLNYDKYFNKVFSDERISKRFLEDFLETRVDAFDMLKGRYRVTDDASLVEFDFRCRIKDTVVILDMQQWYKRDISRRFYLYHALNTGLQLEKLPSKRVIYEHSYEKDPKVKDYRYLKPVLTLVWMADDSLDFKEDYVAYTMTPELVTEFVRNEKLWHKPEIIEILKERERVMEVLGNKTKELDFLYQNRLIFLLQKNIVKNKNNAKYRKWFEFAQKTKKPDNKEEDFEEYLDDEIFCEIARRLNKNQLTQDDYSYIEGERKIWEEVDRWEEGVHEDGIKKGKEEGRAEGMEIGKEAGREEGKKEGMEQGIEKGEKRKTLEIAVKLKAGGLDDQFIADTLGLSMEEMSQLEIKGAD